MGNKLQCTSKPCKVYLKLIFFRHKRVKKKKMKSAKKRKRKKEKKKKKYKKRYSSSESEGNSSDEDSQSVEEIKGKFSLKLSVQTFLSKYKQICIKSFS